MIKYETDFDGLNGFGGSNHAYSGDISMFESGLGGIYSSGGLSFSAYAQANAGSDRMLRQSKKNYEEMISASLKTMAGYVTENKNKMLLESRASSFKKAAELAKEISF